MKGILVKFWLTRFAMVFAGVAVVLSLLQWWQSGAVTLPDVAIWSVATAVLTASLNAWYAYKRQCGQVFPARDG